MGILVLALQKYALNAQLDIFVQVKIKNLKYAQEESKAPLERLNVSDVLKGNPAFRLMLKARLIVQLDSIE